MEQLNLKDALCLFCFFVTYVFIYFLRTHLNMSQEEITFEEPIADDVSERRR